MWYRNNRPYLHEEFYEGGALLSRTRYHHGEIHRVKGPAKEIFHENGKIQWRVWYRHGKEHRLDGPAQKFYYDDGSLDYSAYYLRGEELSQSEHAYQVSLIKAARAARKTKSTKQK